jgi:lysozyme
MLPAVLMLYPGATDSNRLAALTDFTYNLGAGNLRSGTLRRKVNAEAWAALPAELRKWIGEGGRLHGLVARRNVEAALI